MSDPEVDRLLAACREIVKVKSRQDFVEDGLYKGCLIQYANGFEFYHPYVPLITIGVNGDDLSEKGESVIQTRYGPRRMRDGYPVYEDMKRDGDKE